MSIQKLIWEEKYSVGVEEIDNQHKHMFDTINHLLEIISVNTAVKELDSIINALVEYKLLHFATEEKYFLEFNYEGREEHEAKHHEFNDKFGKLREEYPTNTIEFAFKLVDFLEDWLIEHLITMDQKYVQCFHDHGLK
jgi:hemerythrin